MNRLSLVIGSIVALSAFSSVGCSDDDGDDAGTAGTGGTGGTGPTGPACDSFASLAMGPATFTASSAEIGNCATIPAVHTCDQKPFPQGTAPSMTWTAGPTGTMSYALVFKDLAVLGRTDPTDPLYNRGYHYVIWDIPSTVMSLPVGLPGGHLPATVPGARQWSSFNDYAFFGPCPNFDPAMPAAYLDTYSYVVYALPFAKATVPAPVMGTSTVRQLDDIFKSMALAVAEVRGTSAAHASVIPEGVLPPTAMPPCPTTGDQPAGCLAGPP